MRVQTTAVQRQVASWLLAREMEGRQVPAALPDAAERACQKLCQRLAKLVTPAGSQALLARALHLVRPEFPFLEGVQACPQPEVCLGGLPERVQRVEPAVARAGLSAILASLIGLLVTFIGQDLALRLIRDTWPDLPPVEADVDPRETTT